MKKGLLVVLVLIGFCFLACPVFPAEFSETNTQEIGDEVFQACIAKGVIKGSDPQKPVIVMKVRSNCADAFTAIQDFVKTYKPNTSPLPPTPPEPEKKEAPKPKK
jgi:hypothetical protein